MAEHVAGLAQGGGGGRASSHTKHMHGNRTKVEAWRASELPNWRSGFCKRTAFTGCGAGAASGAWQLSRDSVRTWNAAAYLCVSRCLTCPRCRFVSLSLRERDCSWFHDCSLSQLKLRNPTGFRTCDLSHGAHRCYPPTAKVVSQRLPFKGNDIMSWLIPELPPPIPGACFSPLCSARELLRADDGATSLLAPRYPIKPGHIEGDYGHIWQTLETFYQCIVQERLQHRRHGLSRQHHTKALRLFVPSGVWEETLRFDIFKEVLRSQLRAHARSKCMRAVVRAFAHVRRPALPQLHDVIHVPHPDR